MFTRTKDFEICICLLAQLWACGCARIAINGPDKSTQIRYAFGAISIELIPTADTLLSEISALGIVASPAGYSIGFTNQKIATIAPTCKAILWVATREALYEFEKLLGDITTVCPVLVDDKEK